MRNRKTLQRSRNNRWVAGVCGGLAEYFGLNPALLRGLTVFSFFASASLTFWAYIILTFVLPKEAKPAPDRTRVMDGKIVNLGQRKLERVVTRARQHAPLEIQAQVESIYGTAMSLLPQLESGKREMRPIREAVMEYFPDTLESYLRLPPDYAEQHVLADGHTAKEKLQLDLEIIDDTLKHTAAQVYQHTVHKGSRSLETLRSKLDKDPMRDVRRSLQRLEERIDASSLPDEALDKVHNISVTIQALLPQLLRGGGSMSQNIYNVRQTALEYLPDAVNKYLAIPEDFATSQRLSNGMTAYDTLVEQLSLLEDTVLNMMSSAYQDDANGLLVHGRFLEEKFANRRIDLGR